MSYTEGAASDAYAVLFTVSLIILGLCILFCIIRAIIGTRVADRIVSVNMIGTIVLVSIAILSVFLDQAYLADISLIYALVSFVAVIVLTKIYMGIFIEKRKKLEKQNEEAHNNDDT